MTMTYKEFFAAVKNDALPPCVLMHGEEEYTKRRGLEQLRKKMLPEGLEDVNESVFDASASEQAIVEACEAFPFMGEKRLVIVRDHPLVASGRATAAGRSPGDEGILAKYLPSIPPTTLLIFYVRGVADGRKRLSQAIGKAGEIAAFAHLDEGELISFIARECEQRGAKIERRAAQRLIDLCGSDLNQLTGEIGKLCAYAPERVAPADVEAVVIPSLESNVFQFVDSIMGKDAAAALRMLERLRGDGESPIMMLAVMTRAIRQLHQAKLLLDGGQARAQAAKTLGLGGYAAERVLRQAAQLPTAWLLQLQNACVEADFEIKSGALKEDAAFDHLVHRLLEGQNHL